MPEEKDAAAEEDFCDGDDQDVLAGDDGIICPDVPLRGDMISNRGNFSSDKRDCRAIALGGVYIRRLRCDSTYWWDNDK